MTLNKGQEPRNDAGEMFDQQAEDESYKRYKYVQYRNLVIKSLLTFILGLLLSFLLKL